MCQHSLCAKQPGTNTGHFSMPTLHLLQCRNTPACQVFLIHTRFYLNSVSRSQHHTIPTAVPGHRGSAVLHSDPKAPNPPCRATSSISRLALLISISQKKLCHLTYQEVQDPNRALSPLTPPLHFTR